MRDLNPLLIQAQALNKKMQSVFVERAKKRLRLPASGEFMDQYKIPCLKHLNQVLKSDIVDVAVTLQSNIAIMQGVLPHLENMLQDSPQNTICDQEKALLGNYRMCVLA